MKFIPPLEISSKIMTLIKEANRELIIVSPYIQILYWTKMRKCLADAVDSKLILHFLQEMKKGIITVKIIIS